MSARHKRIVLEAQRECHFDAWISFLLIGNKLQTSDSIAVRVDRVNVENGRQHGDIFQRELIALRHKLAVHRYARTAVKVQTIAVAAALIGKQVDAAAFGRGILNEIRSPIGFAQLMVASARVRNDFNAVQCQVNMRSKIDI